MNSSNFCLFTFANSIFILLYSGIKCKGGGSGKKRESFTEKGRENQFPDFPCLFLSHALIQLFRPVAAVGVVRSIAVAISITASVTVLIRAIAVLIFILVLVLVFVLILLKGDVLASLFSTDAAVIQKGFEYLKGFAPETILTAIMFSMVGYFNGNNQTLWVMFQGLFQTLLVRLPMSYYMSIQPAASLTKIGLAAPASTLVGILLNVIFFLYFNKKINERQ